LPVICEKLAVPILLVDARPALGQEILFAFALIGTHTIQ